MSDIYGGLAEYPTAPEPMDSDLSGFDRRITHIGTIEQGWGLPRLPDEVKLDLASRAEESDESIGEFLWGLVADLAEAANPLAAQPAGAQTLEMPEPEVPEFQTSGMLEAKRLWSGWANIDPPQVRDQSAVLRVKRQARAKGLLPESVPLDGSWGPEANSAYRELLQQQKQDQFAGNRPGSVSWSRVFDEVDKWFSPTGLLTVAKELDFVPDLKAGSSEWADWGDKWRRFAAVAGKEDGVVSVERARLFLDALTGPVDDAVVPVVNDLLLLTGVSEIVAVARGVAVAPKAMKGLYGLTRITKGFDAAKDINDLQKVGRGASLLSRGVSHVPGVGKSTAAYMNEWRNLRHVTVAKKTLGVGMRMGQVGLVEQALFPNAHYTGDISEYLERRAETGMVGRAIGDVLLTPFTPTSIWRPGTFRKAGKKAADLAIEHSMLSVMRDSNARAVHEVGRGIANLPAEAWSSPARQEQYLALYKKQGTSAAVADLVGGDEVRAGKLVAYLTLMTAIDSHALGMAQTMVADKTLDPGEWSKVWNTARRSKIAHIKTLDAEDLDAAVDIVAAKKSKGNASKYRLRYRKALEDGDEEMLNGLRGDIARHNVYADAQYQDLLSSLRPGQVEAHVSNFVKHLENWDSFEASMSDIEAFFGPGGGLFDLDAPLRFKSAFSPTGRRVAVNQVSESVQEYVNATYKEGMPGAEKPAVFPKAWFSPLAEDPEPGWWNVTVALQDTVTKQEAREWLAVVKNAKRRKDSVQWMERHPEALEKILANGDLGTMNGKQVSEWLEIEFAGALRPEHRKAVHTLRDLLGAGVEEPARVLRQHGRVKADVTSAIAHYDEILNGLDQSSVWSERFSLASHLKLDDKVKKLDKYSQFLAAELDGLPEELTTKLAERGYKVVKGAGPWVAPNDVLRQLHPFTHLSARDRKILSLGAFFTEVDDQLVMGLQQRKLRDALTKNLQRAGAISPEAVVQAEDAGTPVGDVDFVLDEIRSYLTDRRGKVQDVVNQAEKTGNIIERTQARLAGAVAPANIRDLKYADMEQIFGPLGYDVPRLNAILRSIKESADVGFRYQGLGSVEDWLRGHNQIADVLGLFGRTGVGAAVRNGVAGAVAGGLAGDEVDQGLAGAALGGIAGAALGPKASRKAANLFADSSFYRYGYMADELARVRNHFRFTLSPFFDLSRYTEGIVLGQARSLKNAAGDPINLPVNLSPSSYVKQHGEEGLNRALSNWRNATHGNYEQVVAMEDTERYFTQVGVMGFNPLKWQATTYQRLLDQGMVGDEALKVVRRIYGYGMGRSAAEKSVNFIFFPFSFVKKYNADVASHLADDLGRLMVVHDGLKLFEVLDQEFQLGKELEEHLPVLENLRKLNNFNYGLNLGELGGINRVLLNFFSPQGVLIDSREDAERLQTAMRRSIPVINDVARLVDSLEDQKHVIFDSPIHRTRRAEIDRGWAEWNEFKRAVDAQAKELGYDGWASVMRSDNLAAVREQVKTYRAELRDKYPSWAGEVAHAVERRVKTNAEIEQRLYSPKTEADVDLAEFAQFEDELGSMLAQAGISVTEDPELLPPDVYDAVREYALELAARGNGFEDLYQRYYERTWGPVSRELA